MKKSYTIVLLFIIFIASRLYFLFTFPPFTDESLYIRWGQLMIYNPGYRWASITYVSRQPLAMWIFGLASTVFQHPLYGARLTVLAVNIPVFFALSNIMKRSYSNRVRYIALGILAVSPLFILTQTLALMDGFLFAVSCYILWLLLIPWKNKFPIHMLLIAALLGFALWIKTTAFLVFLVALLALVWKKLRGEVSTGQFVISMAVWIVLPVIIVLPLVLRPDISHIMNEPGSFVFTLKELLQFPVSIWTRNALVTPVVLLLYLNPLVLLFAYRLGRPKFKDADLLFILWLIVPLAIALIIGKNLRARYYIIGTIGVIPLLAFAASNFFDHIKQKSVFVLFVGLFCLWGLFFVMYPPAFFRLFPTATDEQNYALSWPSGYGIPELITWIDAHVPRDKILLLAVPDSPGNPSDYLLTYYYFKPYVRILFATTTNIRDFRKLEPITIKGPVYLATRQSLLTPQIRQFLTPVVVFEKPYNEDAIGLYQISFTASH